MAGFMRLKKQLLAVAALGAAALSSLAVETGSAIFIHPDGTGLGHWNAGRHLHAGPDGQLHWDGLDRLAAYRPHQKNWLSTTSHAGATVHAYGRKVHHDSYGMDRVQPLTALSGKPLTIMEEALAAGLKVGIVNTGHIGEPGTGVFLARSEEREAIPEIGRQILESGADVIFCAGERYLIPKGQTGQHGQQGVRTDGRHLLREAEGRGYTVIYTREELLALPSKAGKVIGIFAAEDTYNAASEDKLKAAGLETYNPGQPTFAEMVEVALRLLGSRPDQHFLLVAEEEGTDNFSNATNAKGMLDAVGRADAGIGAALRFMADQPDRSTFLVIGADSDAGHPAIYVPRGVGADYTLPATTDTGAQLDGQDGQGGRPFMARPDAYGNGYPFGIAWPASGDYPGSVVTKAHGFKSDLLKSSVDNTDIYRMIYEVLFGTPPGGK